ncbi:transglutaminase-like cysteine peptidase [Sulfurivirga sp.]|uniref:transglutaminase-like cysteine peptidase n=1 Tax=Sulfurivirga sp. TaxID=2614236 RepID=UPI0025D3EF91|nr:transglutaminase-like cysteine peptidase [Sulfurivirga sp.]
MTSRPFRLLLSVLLLWSLCWADLPPQVVTEAQIKAAEKRFGPQAAKRLRAWQRLVDQSWELPEREKLKRVNDFFNQARFVDDRILWHKQDYWATPVEFLGKFAGDCEDFAIAKYLTLRMLRVPEKKLFLTYVKAIRLRQAHMVVTYFPKPLSVPLVLDNINPRILPATQRRDLVPIYSFNGRGLWLAKQRGKGKLLGQSTRLKKWRHLLQRLKGSNPQ